jgi:hypothetical protein
MERIDLDSTALAWVRYLPAEEVLQIGIRGGQAYEYSTVSEQTYRDLLAAKSKGRYYNQHIRNAFPWRLLRRFGAG